MDPSQEEQLTQRFTLATFLEAARLVEEGIAAAEDIDVAMRAGAGFKEGPFHWADRQGLDRVLSQLTDLSREVGPRFLPPRSLIELVQRGRLGIKTGRGYLAYERSDNG